MNGERKNIQCFEIVFKTITFFISLSLFIVVMIVYSQINNDNVSYLDTSYIDMINWIKSFAVIEIISLCFSFTIPLILSNVNFMIFQTHSFGICYIIEIVYVAFAVPIRNNMLFECKHIDINSTEMCEFFQTKFSPIANTLIFIMIIDSIYIFILGCILCHYLIYTRSPLNYYVYINELDCC